MSALHRLGFLLAFFGSVHCAPTPPAVAVPAEPLVARHATKPPADGTLSLASVELAVVHWPSLGQKIAVTLRDMGDSYQLTAKGLLPGLSFNRTWTSQVAKTAELENLLSILNPLRLTEKDPCSRSWRDGTSWIVVKVVEGTKTSRSRDANGTLALAECRSFDDACRQIMKMAGITCAIGKPCVPAEERVPADAGPL